MEINNNKREQDFITNKILIVFTMVFIGIFSTMYISKMSNYFDTFELSQNIIKILSVASFAGLIASIGKWWTEVKNKTKTSLKYITGRNLTCVFTVISIFFVDSLIHCRA